MFKIEHNNLKGTLVTKTQKTIDPDNHFRVLHTLEENPHSQTLLILLCG